MGEKCEFGNLNDAFNVLCMYVSRTIYRSPVLGLPRVVQTKPQPTLEEVIRQKRTPRGLTNVLARSPVLDRERECHGGCSHSRLFLIGEDHVTPEVLEHGGPFTM